MSVSNTVEYLAIKRAYSKLCVGFRAARKSLFRGLYAEHLLSDDIRQFCGDTSVPDDKFAEIMVIALQERVVNDSHAFYSIVEVLKQTVGTEYLANVLEKLAFEKDSLPERVQPLVKSSSPVGQSPDSTCKFTPPYQRYIDKSNDDGEKMLLSRLEAENERLRKRYEGMEASNFKVSLDLATVQAENESLCQQLLHCTECMRDLQAENKCLRQQLLQEHTKTECMRIELEHERHKRPNVEFAGSHVRTSKKRYQLCKYSDGAILSSNSFQEMINDDYTSDMDSSSSPIVTSRGSPLSDDSTDEEFYTPDNSIAD